MEDQKPDAEGVAAALTLLLDGMGECEIKSALSLAIPGGRRIMVMRASDIWTLDAAFDSIRHAAKNVESICDGQSPLGRHAQEIIRSDVRRVKEELGIIEHVLDDPLSDKGRRK